MADLNPEQQRSYIADFIVRHPLGILCTISAGGMPASAPVYVGVKPDLTCYFQTRVNTQKYDNLIRDAHIALSIVDDTTLETVQMNCTASVLTGNVEVVEAMDSLHRIIAKEKPRWMAYTEKISQGIFKTDVSRWEAPLGQLPEGGATAFVQIKPQWLRYRRYDADWKISKGLTEYLIKDM